MEATTISVKNAVGEEFLQIEHDETNRWIYACWIGEITVEDIKIGGEKKLEQIKLLSYPKIIVDHRKTTGAWDDANEWIQKSWLPRVIASGLQKLAIIQSPDIFSAMTTEELVAKINDFEMRIFDEIEEAKAWLNS